MPEPIDSSPLTDDPASFEIVTSEPVFEGRVWDIRREEFRYNDEIILRDFVDHTGAVAVLALDDEDRVLLIKQYRHPIRQRDWEIPAGLLDIVGEDPLVGAQRELAEEADLRAGRWDLLSEFYTSPGGSNEAIRVYLARELRPSDVSFDRTEEEADIEKRWVSLDEAVTGVLARRLQNPILAMSVLVAQNLRSANWAGLGDVNEPWTRHPRFRG